MWEPVGPLPAHVYWKRRWLALAGVIGMFMVIGFSVAALTAPSSDLGPQEEPTTQAAHRSELSASAAADPTGTDPTTTDPTTTDPTTTDPTATSTSGATPLLSATGVPAGTGPLVEGAPETTDESKRPDDTPRAAVPVPPTESAPATGPPVCTNDMIDVGAEIDAPQHTVGDRPELRLVVVNVSPQACVRDLDGALQEIVVWDRAIQNRLWSSNDCVNPSTQDLRTLVPGQPVAFAVTWSGLSSNPGCTAPRTRLPAGEYTLLTRVADRISGPTPFTLVPR
ncbi:hypothetical protein [Pseudonocardia xishanensis]|uniref:MucR family transcriptional regulator n=1 Tax=Pseudonocardia xishanensis TaxID=630995 RepID=A0ABP8RD38_9PSEU